MSQTDAVEDRLCYISLEFCDISFLLYFHFYQFDVYHVVL
jgi:hypothetical protein